MVVTNKFKVDVIWWTFVLPSDIISAPNTSSIRTGKFPGFLCKVLRQQPHRPVDINFVSQHFWRQLSGGQGETGIGNMHSGEKALQTCRLAHCGLPQPEYWNKHCLGTQQSTWLGIFVKPWESIWFSVIFLPFLSKEICSTFSHRGCFSHCVSEANYGPIIDGRRPQLYLKIQNTICEP